MSLLPSQICLLSSTTIYPVLAYFLNRHPRPLHRLERYVKVNKSLSTLHSSLITILAIYALRRQDWRPSNSSATWSRPKSSRSGPSGPGLTDGNFNEDDSQNPFIIARSEFANSITAIETGYLIQDTVALLLQHYRYKDPKLEKTLLLHHVGIGAALSYLQYWIARGWETGIYVIVMFLLMNASTPLLNLRWFLRKYQTGRTRLILGVDAAFAAAFFAARVWLIYGLLGYYGRYHGKTPMQAFARLRTPCKLGTGTLWTANIAWWCELVQSVIARAQDVV